MTFRRLSAWLVRVALDCSVPGGVFSRFRRRVYRYIQMECALTLALTALAAGSIRAADPPAKPDILLIMLVLGVVSAFGLNFQLTSALMARQEFEKTAQAL